MTNKLKTKLLRIRRSVHRAFTLIEIITVLVIVSLVIIATLGIHGRVSQAAATINKKLKENVLATEVLQRIAEDLDRLTYPGYDTTVKINNKFNQGHNVSMLTIENKIYNAKNQQKTFEKVVWQSSYDSFTEQLVLYRSHSGIALEDKIIDQGVSFNEMSQEELQQIGVELYVPICSGMSFFKIEVPSGEKTLATWVSNKPPTSIVATISFAEPIEVATGQFEVPEEKKITRIVAIDRTRRIRYIFVKKEFEIEDPNEVELTEMDEMESFEEYPEGKTNRPVSNTINKDAEINKRKNNSDRGNGKRRAR